MKKIYYAGIGSREAPDPMLYLMEGVAFKLGTFDWMCLRTGGASGSDTAFEAGATSAGGDMELWLPWTNFNGRGNGYTPSIKHNAYASGFHPVWDKLKPVVKKLHSRNVGIILGEDLKTTVSFVVCWTKDGCEKACDRTNNTGGTGHAIAVADANNIPIFNLKNEGRIKELIIFINKLKVKYETS